MADLPFPYLDPAQTPAWIDAQRKQQMAQMLMQSFQQTNQTPADWNSMKVVPKRGMLQNVSALAEALMAGKSQKDAFTANTDYMKGMYGPQQASTGPGAGIVSPTAPPAAQDAAQAVTNSPSTSGLLPPQQPPQNPLIPPGMSTGTANAMIGMMGPQEYAKSLIAPNYVPLEIQRQLAAAGIAPNSPQGQAIIARTVQKGAYIAPIEQREGSVERDPLTNSVIGENPKLPQGGVNFYDPKGNLTGSGMSPGAAGAISQSTAASTAGTVSQTPQKIGVDAQGRDVFVYPTPPALAGQGGKAPTGTQPQGQTASEATLEAQKKGGEAGQTYASELSKNATGATEVRRSLSELKNLASQANPSAANESKMKLGAMMIAAGVNPDTAGKWLGVDVGALQAAQKQTATLAVNTIHSMTSRGTNFDLDTFMRNNPNMNMADPASFSRVVAYMDNKAKQEIAKQKDFAQWKKGISPDDWETGHTAHWLDQQNQDIDKGLSASPRPTPSLQDLQAEAARRGLKAP